MTAKATTQTPMSKMNTTPLIDVMLVLLIMFLITLPIQTHAVSIDLPTDGGPEAQALENRITIDPRGATFWNGGRVDQVQLARLLGTARAMQPTPTLLLQPDPDAPYLIVDQIVALVRRTGTETLSLVGNEQHANAF
jgi:biopolymer transport protein ExbD